MAPWDLFPELLGPSSTARRDPRRANTRQMRRVCCSICAKGTNGSRLPGTEGWARSTAARIWVLRYGDFMRIWGFPKIGRPNHPPHVWKPSYGRYGLWLRLNGAAWDVSMYHLCLRWSKHAYITYVVYPLLWPLKNWENDENPSHFGAPYMVCRYLMVFIRLYLPTTFVCKSRSRPNHGQTGE